MRGRRFSCRCTLILKLVQLDHFVHFDVVLVQIVKIGQVLYGVEVVLFLGPVTARRVRQMMMMVMMKKMMVVIVVTAQFVIITTAAALRGRVQVRSGDQVINRGQIARYGARFVATTVTATLRCVEHILIVDVVQYGIVVIVAFVKFLLERVGVVDHVMIERFVRIVERNGRMRSGVRGSSRRHGRRGRVGGRRGRRRGRAEFHQIFNLFVHFSGCGFAAAVGHRLMFNVGDGRQMQQLRRRVVVFIERVTLGRAVGCARSVVEQMMSAQMMMAKARVGRRICGCRGGGCRCVVVIRVCVV